MAIVIEKSPATLNTVAVQLPTAGFRSVTFRVGGSGTDIVYISTNGTTPSSTNHSYRLLAGEACEIFSSQVQVSHNILLVSDSSSVVIWSM
jgi:hypothetical protein